MTVPNFPNKHSFKPLFSARDLVQADPAKFPPLETRHFILCFQNHTLQYLTKSGRARKRKGGFGETYILKTRRPVGVAGNFGIGAPAAVFMMEWLAALGVDTFLVVGFAGGLNETLSAGDLVLCDRALRDEGTSYHYQEAAPYAYPSASLVQSWARTLGDRGIPFQTGGSWTTDAPFRETFPEVRQYAGEGLLSVEMESAALFSAAQALGLSCAAAFSIGDSLRGERWNLDFDRTAMSRGLETLAASALAMIDSLTRK